MNVLHKYTRKTLACNRTRTLVTIVGIILSLSMLTAVTTLISSMQHYMWTVTVAAAGRWHGAVYNEKSETVAQAVEDSRVKGAALLDNLGYDTLPANDNFYKPYLFVAAMHPGFTDMIPLRLEEGRMPENPGEILVPEHLLLQTGNQYQVGDTLTVSLHDRYDQEGQQLEQYLALRTDPEENVTETLTDLQDTRSYTVVGIVSRPVCEPHVAPGYTFLTVTDGGSYRQDAYFEMEDPNHIWDFLERFPDSTVDTNYDLLRTTASSGEEVFNALLYSLGAVLIGIIMLASISLIYNAFSISVSERTRQFGLLSSVGATHRQLIRCVLYEALVLCVVGIPLGILAGIGGIGVTLHFLSDAFKSLFVDTAGSQEGLTLYVSWGAVAVAAVTGLLTVLISARKPMKRALRMSAIEAIRQSGDVKIKAGQVKNSRLTYRLFGLEGTLASKNFRRARRKYRSTVFSLTVSVVLFITAASFSTYLTDSAGTLVDDPGCDLYCEVWHDTDDPEDNADRIYEVLTGVEGVTRSGRFLVWMPQATIPADSFTQTYRDFNGITDSETRTVTLIFMDADNYARYLRENRLDAALLTNGKAVAVNMEKRFDEGKYAVMDVLEQAQTLTLTNGTEIEVAALTRNAPYGAEMGKGNLMLILPYGMWDDMVPADAGITESMVFDADDHGAVYERMARSLRAQKLHSYSLQDFAEAGAVSRALITIVKVFSYGFIALISLISVANVFNTISTNVHLRRREFATLASVGMTQRSFRKMMNFECIFYGVKGLMFGLPLSVLTTFGVYSSLRNGWNVPFTMPWGAVAVAVGSVFVVVFATMLYAMSKLKGRDLTDAMKNENL